VLLTNLHCTVSLATQPKSKTCSCKTQQHIAMILCQGIDWAISQVSCANHSKTFSPARRKISIMLFFFLVKDTVPSLLLGWTPDLNLTSCWVSVSMTLRPSTLLGSDERDDNGNENSRATISEGWISASSSVGRSTPLGQFMEVFPIKPIFASFMLV